jgi:hypothetical protein
MRASKARAGRRAGLIVAVKPANNAEHPAEQSAVEGGDQGECGPAKHVPDAEPGKRVTGSGTHTAHICRYDPW